MARDRRVFVAVLGLLAVWFYGTYAVVRFGVWWTLLEWAGTVVRFVLGQ